jgi:RNA polymerase sigma factor (sigma-70 family)
MDSDQEREMQSTTIRRAQAGDRAAMNRVLGWLRSEEKSYARRLLRRSRRSRTDVSDVLQHALLRVHRKLPVLTALSTGRLRAYFRRALQNTWWNILRKDRQKKRGGGQGGVSIESGDSSFVRRPGDVRAESPDIPLIRQEEEEEFQFRLSHLPAREREAVAFFRDGVRRAEIALRMNLTVGAVDGLLRRAKEKLQTNCKRCQ